MKLHTKTIGNEKVTSYNDSNIDWVVYSTNHSTQRFPKNKWTMKDAVRLYCEIFKIG